LQSSDSRKKISFRWNSRGFSTGSVLVASKSAEQRSTESAESSKLVPYEDDSETEKETAETIENMHVAAEKTNDRDGLCAENTCSLAAMSLLNGKDDDDDVSPSDAEKLCKPADPVMMSSTANGVSGSVERLPSFDDDNIGTSILSKPVSVPGVEATSAEKEDAASLSGTAAGGFAADYGTGCQLRNGHLFGDDNSVSHAVAGRKRHARHKSKKHHKKHRRHHAVSDWDSSDEELEYVWVEKTAETIAQQHTGKYQL